MFLAQFTEIFWHRSLAKGAGATGAAGAAAPFALVVRGQRGGSIVPYQYLNFQGTTPKPSHFSSIGFTADLEMPFPLFLSPPPLS